MMPMNQFPPLPPRASAPSAPVAEMAEESVEEMNGGERKVVISPEAVCYRDAEQTCGNCKYMQPDGECEALEIQVAEGAGCNLFTEGE